MNRLVWCGMLVGAMAVGADVLIDDFENAGVNDKAHWTSIGEAINKSYPAQYISYWYYYDDSINNGKSYMEPNLSKDSGVAESWALCQKGGEGVNASKGFHQKWYFDGNGGKWPYPYLAIGFDYHGSGQFIDMTNLTAISLYAKGTPGKTFEFTIETLIPKTSFSGKFTLTEAWTKHKMAPSSFAVAQSGKTWNDVKTQTTSSHLHMNGKPGDTVEFWLDSLVFEGMNIDAFINAAPVKQPPPAAVARSKHFTIAAKGMSPAVSFKLTSAETVHLAVFDLTGGMAVVLANGALPAGTHDFTVDRNRVGGPGTYIVRLKTGAAASTAMLVLK